MIRITDKAKCSGCYACVDKCPKKCIQMVSDSEGFWYPSVEVSECIDCGLCEKACPILENKLNETHENIVAYVAKNKSDSIRLESSSGGVFFALARYILAKDGAVFGAAFDENFDVVHRCVTNIEELSALQGSKYVQSRIGDTYEQACVLLEQGKKVLFR